MTIESTSIVNMHNVTCSRVGTLWTGGRCHSLNGARGVPHTKMLRRAYLSGAERGRKKRSKRQTNKLKQLEMTILQLLVHPQRTHKQMFLAHHHPTLKLTHLQPLGLVPVMHLIQVKLLIKVTQHLFFSE